MTALEPNKALSKCGGLCYRALENRVYPRSWQVSGKAALPSHATLFHRPRPPALAHEKAREEPASLDEPTW
jgi:hypothetical protein